MGNQIGDKGNRIGGKMGDRTYYVAEVRVEGERVIFLDPESPTPSGTVVSDIIRASKNHYTDRTFFVAYMQFGLWLTGHGRNLQRATTSLRERYSEAIES